VQTTPFVTWTPAPTPMTERERALLLLTREAYDRDPAAAAVTLSMEALGALLAQVDRLEAERDRLGDQGISERQRANRVQRQLMSVLARYAPIATWASQQLGCAPKLAELTAAIQRIER
jgi:hypothetical protein